MNTEITSFDQLPITLNADQVAKVLHVSRSQAYVVMHRKGFPTLRVGNRMVVPKESLKLWMEKNAGNF